MKQPLPRMPEDLDPGGLRAHLAAIVASSADAILSKSLDGTVLSWNLGAEKLYGYTADEIVGKPVSILVPPDRLGEIEDILARVKRGEVIDHFETLRIHKDGTAVPVSVTISPIKDADGNIIAASTIARAVRVGDDRDRSAEDRDQRAEVQDQESETRDERGEARDHRADARDEAAVSDRAAAFRDRRGAASDRMQAADDRQAAAPEDRDHEAEAHDHESETREARGLARDQRAEARDVAAFTDREAALRDRRGAANDRMQAADDREAAAADRVLSAWERAVSSIDDLTGAHRRDSGTLELEREIARAKRTHQRLLLAFIDVDSLKARNDVLGHAAGDQLLRSTVNSLRAHLRSYDLIVRFGGDEFVCALLDMSTSEAATRFETINADLAETENGSITVGLAELRAEDSLEGVIARADEALYRKREQ